MKGEELLQGLHDGLVQSLAYEWQARSLRLHLVGEGGRVVAVHARGVTRVSWSNEMPWGESREMCINEVESRAAFGCDVLEFLMSTGDRLLVEAKEIEVTATGDAVK